MFLCDYSRPEWPGVNEQLPTTAGACEVARKLKDVHDTRQQEDIQKEYQWRPSIKIVTEVRALDQQMTHEHLQWTLPSKIVWTKGHATASMPRFFCLFCFVSFDFFGGVLLLNFVLVERSQGQKVKSREQGHEWDWDAWCKPHKESKKIKIHNYSMYGK